MAAKSRRSRKKEVPSQETKTLLKIPVISSFKPGHVIWSFSDFDPAANWGTVNTRNLPFLYIADKLKSYQRLGWDGIQRDISKHHPVEISNLVKKAQDRIRVLKIVADSLFAFRFSSTQRLWGVRYQDVYSVLWWDPDHEVCPSHLKQ